MRRQIQQDAEEDKAPRPDPAPDDRRSKRLKKQLLLLVVAELFAGKKGGFGGLSGGNVFLDISLVFSEIVSKALLAFSFPRYPILVLLKEKQYIFIHWSSSSHVGVPPV